MGELRCEELAVRLGISPRDVFTLLDEDLERGLVERDVDGRWRLTPHAEAHYGQALRDITPAEQPYPRGQRTRLAPGRTSRAFAPRPRRARPASRRLVRKGADA